MKKFIILLCLSVAGMYLHAQNGLQKIFVERYYVTDATDAQYSNPQLPAGSVTYRIYADMLPGYKVQSIYGSSSHNLLMNTTTTFFNQGDYGSTIPTFSATNAKKNTVMIDSWITTGGACSGYNGVPKTQDNATGNFVNSNNPQLLQNNAAQAGIPLTTRDGMYSGSVPSTITIGIPDEMLAVLGDGSVNGSTFELTDGAWACLAGATGPIADSNYVLIAQITTNGIFHFELNIQIGTPSGGTEKYVASNPGSDEFTIPSLTRTLYPTPVLPSISITAPSNNATYGMNVPFTVSANANDTDGWITKVEFFVDGSSIGVVTSSPYSLSYSNAVQGAHVLTAVATDNDGQTTTSSAVNFNIGNAPPSVSITNPLNGATPALNEPLNLVALASDLDGSVVSVEFFSGSTSLGLGTLSTGSYHLTFTPTVQGPMVLTAVATDNEGAVTTSAAVNVVITDFNAAYSFAYINQPCYESICMPINSVNTVTGVIGYNFTIQYDKTKVVPTGVVTVSSDMISPTVLNGQLPDFVTDYTTYADTANGLLSVAIYFNSNGGINASFNGTGQVCCVGFAKTDNFQSVDATSFSFSEIIESYPTSALSKTGAPGSLSTYVQTTMLGSLKFWSDSSPIQYDPNNPNTYLVTNIYGCNQSANPVQPDVIGNFIYDIVNGSTVDIRRDIAAGTIVHTVISSQDAYLTALTSVKGNDQINWTPSVYQMVSMDVNRDGQVTAGDATQINQRAVLLIPEFTQVGSLGKDWSFISNATVTNNVAYHISNSFPEDDGVGYSKYRVPVVDVCQDVPIQGSVECPQVGSETYWGVLIGDVDSTYASIIPNGLLKNAVTDSTRMIILDLSRATYSNGILDVPVSLTLNQSVHSLDFDMQVNTSDVQVSSVSSPYSNVNLSWNYIPAVSTLSVAAFCLDTISRDNTLSIKFAVESASSVSSSNLIGSYALINGENASLLVIDGTTGMGDKVSYNNVIIYPNPASDQLSVLTSVDSKIQLFNMNGKQVSSEELVNASQLKSIDVSNLSPGVYMVKIFNETSVSMKKVVIKR